MRTVDGHGLMSIYANQGFCGRTVCLFSTVLVKCGGNSIDVERKRFWTQHCKEIQLQFIQIVYGRPDSFMTSCSHPHRNVHFEIFDPYFNNTSKNNSTPA